MTVLIAEHLELNRIERELIKSRAALKQLQNVCLYYPTPDAFNDLLKSYSKIKNISLLLIAIQSQQSQPLPITDSVRNRLEYVACHTRQSDIIIAAKDGDPIYSPHTAKCPPQTAREGQQIYGTQKFVPADDWKAAYTLAHELHTTRKYGLVLVVDITLFEIAHPDYLVRAMYYSIQYSYALLCANGRGDDDVYYDLQSTVLENGIPLTDASFARESANFNGVADAFSHTLAQHPTDVYMVKSCFGGLAMYNPKSYFQCMYHTGPSSKQHSTTRVINKCVCDDEHAKCAILNTLETRRPGTILRRSRKSFL
eukprot:TRINITY_DN18211_c0_g1_i1.p1 TRINITY_DN18211_c0_g1~~TRINITY_DN18211_c0_g1_i1.p1  ORF type:complete len:342 (+),score=16.88 TRINITY_DN18211_c0_g1_i1:96-1028(+)